MGPPGTHEEDITKACPGRFRFCGKLSRERVRIHFSKALLSVEFAGRSGSANGLLLARLLLQLRTRFAVVKVRS